MLNVEKVIEFIDERLEGIRERPLMYGGTMHATEVMACEFLEIRARVNGTNSIRLKYRMWLNDNFDDIPLSIRSISSAVKIRYGTRDHTKKFGEYLNAMIDHIVKGEECQGNN